MSEQGLNVQLKGFKTISLPHLNATASFLRRIEYKYLLNSNDFISIIKDLRRNFNILEIDGKKVFTYDNIYMDTNNYLFYKQHQDRLNSRVKVRTRLYVDSNLAFFEFKHKLNGVTSKYRYEFPAHEHGFITKGKKRFFDGVWQSIYNTKAPELTPSIKTNYKRITMVSKKGDERITIDFNVTATNLRKKDVTPISLKNLIIIESKSMKNARLTNEIMEKHKIEKASNCSKYSLGIIYSGLAEKYDTFRETMEKIREIRMETVKVGRTKDNKRNASLSNIIKEMKADTIEKVNTIVA